jgi:undecaprenyl-diphosphatase
MVVPLILGKIGYELLLGDGLESSVSAVALGIGFTTAFGILACKWMIRLVVLSVEIFYGIVSEQAYLRLFVIIIQG